MWGATRSDLTPNDGLVVGIIVRFLEKSGLFLSINWIQQIRPCNWTFFFGSVGI